MLKSEAKLRAKQASELDNKTENEDETLEEKGKKDIPKQVEGLRCIIMVVNAYMSSNIVSSTMLHL